MMRQDGVADLMAVGVRQYGEGRHAEAAATARQVLAMQPGHPGAGHLLGLSALSLGLWDEGIGALEAVLAAQPHDHQVRLNLARAREFRGEHHAVIALLEEAIRHHPDLLDAYRPLAAAQWASGDRHGAIDTYRGLARSCPDDAPAQRMLAAALIQADFADEARPVLARAAALAPGDPETRLLQVESDLRAIMPQLAGSPSESPVRAQALALLPLLSQPMHLRRLGRALLSLNAPDEALMVLERLGPGLPNDERAGICTDLAAIHTRQRRFAEAEAQYRAAINLAPGDAAARAGLAMLQLLQGRFAEGWDGYEARLRVPTHVVPVRGPSPWHAPADLTGTTVRVVLEQGLGDTLQFIRYVPLLAARGARVEVAAPTQRAVLPLIANVAGLAAVVEAALAAPVPEIVVPLLSLPLAFGTTLAGIPGDVPYLAAPADRSAKWQAILAAHGAHDGRPRVGVVWSGAMSHPNNRHRSIGLPRFLRLLQRPDLAFHVLADRVEGHDAELLGNHARIHDGLADFADTAALVEMMDLVITVDSSVAHLAGALGKPVWILLPANPDWRWLLDRTDSPWYPTARLFRQPAHNDWDAVLSDVERALHDRFG